MIEKPVYIITFDSANYSMYLYKLLKEQSIKIYMIQTPCCLSAGCARSIEVSEDKIDNVIEIIKDKNAPDRKSTRLNSSHTRPSRMPSSA